MKVSDLRELAQSLASASRDDSAKIAKQWDKLNEALLPFDELTFAEFAQLLSKVEPSLSSASAEKTSTTIDGPLVESSVEQLNVLFDRAIESDTSYAAITQNVASIINPLKKNEAIEVAKQFGIVESIRSKKDAHQKIENRITGRKEGHDHLMSVRDL